MSNDGRDPIGAYHFSLKLQGTPGDVATFTEASGFDSETQVIEFREVDSGGKIFIRKTIGGTKWADITLKRGMIQNDNKLFQWRQSVLDGDYSKARINGSVIGRNAKGEPTVQFDFVNGWISKWKGPSFSAKANDVALEEITITHEGLTRTV